MIAPKPDLRSPERKRYPGTRPFSDSPDDRKIFFGRKADIDRLFERMLGVRLLVLFGKSGLGKTSLLMAGVFPRLREKPFLPVPIRVNGADSPVQTVVAAMAEACQRADAEFTPGDGGGIWELVKTSLIWKDDLLLTPVLVFDQFEEVFTLRDAGFRSELAAELGALASGTPPERLRTTPRDGAGSRARLGEQPPEVKILLSLREEYLGTLQELSTDIPGLFLERMRLTALTEKDAREAICSPAECHEEPGDAPFATPCFVYAEDALTAMVTFLGDGSQKVEPFHLQLLCCRAEEIVAGRARQVEPICITRAELGGLAGMEAVLSQFYRRVIGLLPWRERRTARQLCEEGLLSATGSRLMLDQAQIESDYGISATALATLVDERLLRREQRLESLFYEISHDRIAESIKRNRPFRIPKTLRHALRGAAAVALLTIGLLVWWNRRIEVARSDAENLVAFLIGDSFLETLRPVGRNEILEEVQAKVKEYLEKAPDPDEPGQRRTRGLALRNEGDILQSRGRLADAVSRFEGSAKLFEGLADAEPESLEHRAERARSLHRLGDALHDQGRITDSLEAHQAALELREAVNKGGLRGTESTIDLAESCSAVGRMLSELGRPRQALDQLDQARDLLQRIDPCAPRSPRMFKVQHDAIDNRAASLSMIGDATGERSCYADALQITQEWILRQPLSADARMREVTAISRLANKQMELGAPEQALEQYARINRAVEELIHWDPSNSLWKCDFAATLILVAEGQVALDRYQEATDSYDAALKALDEMVEIDPSNMMLKQELYWFFRSRGSLAVGLGDWAQAIKDFTAALEFIKKATSADPAFATWKRESCLTLVELAHAESSAGMRAESATLLRRGRDDLTSLIETSPEMAILRDDRFFVLEEEIRALAACGRKDEAAALAREKMEAVTSALAAEPLNPRLLNHAFFDDTRTGDDARSAGRLDDAIAAYRSGLEKIARAAELAPTDAVFLQNLQAAHKQIGDAFLEGKRWVEAEEAYRNGLGPGERRFAIAFHRSEAANQLFLLQLAIADTQKAAGRAESALTEFERTREWIDKAIEAGGQVAVYFGNRRALFARVAQTRAALGDVSGAREAYSTATAAGARAVELANGAARKAEFANNVYLVLLEEGDWDAGRGDHGAGLQGYERAGEWIDKAIAFDGGVAAYFGNRRDLLSRVARSKAALGNAGGAREAYGAATAAGSRAFELEDDAARKARFANYVQLVLIKAGDWHAGLGDQDAALQAYAEAGEWIDKAIELDGRVAVFFNNRRELLLRVAGIKLTLNDVNGVQEAYSMAAAAGSRAFELETDAGERREFANNMNLVHVKAADWHANRGELNVALRDCELAGEWINKAIEIDGRVASHFNNRRELYERVARIRAALNDVDGVREAYRTAATSGERAVELAEGPGEKATFANSVSHVHIEAGDWHAGRGDQDAALQAYDAARPWIDKAIAADGDSSVYTGNLGILEVRIGNTKESIGDMPDAETSFRAAIEEGARALSLAVAKEDAAEQAARASSLHVAHEALARCLEGSGNVAGALEEHGRALVALGRAADLDPKNAEHPSAMRVIHRDTARLREAAGDVAGAETDLRAGAEEGLRAAALDHSAVAANEAGLGFDELGNLFVRTESTSEAVIAFDSAAHNFERAIELDPTIAVFQLNVCIARWWTGSFRRDSGDLVQAQNDLEAAVHSGRRSTELAADDGGSWRFRCFAERELAVLLEEQGAASEALRLFQAALKSAMQATLLLPEDANISAVVEQLKEDVAKRSR